MSISNVIIVMKMAVRIIIVQKPMEACIALSGIRISIKTGNYYDENAKMARGTTKIGKTTYEFDNEGVLSANGAVLMELPIDLPIKMEFW